jgi:predicted ribosomally synthesized peptide with SipW-like signal peptide
MTDDRFDLSRRKVLGSLGAIGIASAGAGLGTSAYFNDDESLTDNVLNAGKLDLLVDYHTSYDQGSFDSGSDSGTVDGNPSTYSYEISDVKPGDSGSLQFCPKVVDNDAWVWIGSEDGVVDFENGLTDPESEVDGSGGAPGRGNGELSDEVLVTVSYCDEQGDVIREFDNPDGYTLADLSKELESGFLLDGDDVSDGTTDPYPGSADEDAQSGPCLCIDWELPTHVGNKVQTDSAALDISFVAAQRRHNDAPNNPFADDTVFPGESIQDAIDTAASGDTISVFGWGSAFEEQLTVETGGLTLARASAERPTVDAGGASPVVSIDADGVTVDGFAVTSPDGLLGIKVQSNIDDAQLCNNRIFDLGPTGSLGVSGIIVDQGDHSGIDIFGNTIEDLFQTDDGSFATVNGIIFDADNSNPGLLTDTTVERNRIRNLESTTAPLGIVVQHRVDGLTVEANTVSSLTADNSLGPGSFTTFAQGLSIDSPATTDFDIVDNTIEDVVSEGVDSGDGFFGEDIKIEPSADVSGIGVHGNNLLSAIGLNNANGNNPPVAAENNYWNSSTGPFVIQNNDDDGDVPTGSGQVDLDTVTASAVTPNVDFDPFAGGQF